MSKSGLRGSPMKATDTQIKAAYRKAKSCKGAAAILGMCPQSVHERLVRLNVKRRSPKWMEQEDSVLREQYPKYQAAGKVAELAKQMGRSRISICMRASRLGISHRRGEGPKEWNRVWKGMSEKKATAIFEAFKRSRLGLGQFCKKHGYDDLGFSRTMQEHFPDEWEHVIEIKAPRQSKYRLGRAVEYGVRDDLRGRGYVAIRSPASKSPLDIVAVKTGKVLFIQCKRNMALTVTEWNEIYDLAISVSAIPVLAGRPTGRGLIYKKMTGRKDGSKRSQPFEDFTP